MFFGYRVSYRMPRMALMTQSCACCVQPLCIWT